MNTDTSKKQRSCIGCGKRAQKGDMYRVARMVSGDVVFDATNRASGRGAYVCSVDCFNVAVKAHRFNRALRVKIDEEVLDNIKTELERACAVEG